MKDLLKKFVLPVGILILLIFVIFVVNQTAQIVAMASKINEGFGAAVLWGLIAFYCLLVAVPIVMFLRLPRSIRPPASDHHSAFPSYLEQVRKRLASNPALRGMKLSGRDGVEEALAVLGQKADERIEANASTVFLATAISQNGRLDAFLVLSAQTRMIWQIAHLYYQRPGFRDLVSLYANVAATAFIASELDDIDVSEQVEPVLSATFGALTGSIPGFQLVASILVTSILTGAANAFLTLRVGIIAKAYCGSLMAQEKRILRRSAAVQAAGMLGGIVRQGTAKVAKAIWDVSKDKVGKTFSEATSRARDKGASLLEKIGLRKRKGYIDGQMQMDLLGNDDPVGVQGPQRTPEGRRRAHGGTIAGSEGEIL